MSAHLKTQAIRFGRLFAVALVAQLVTLGTGHLGWKALGAVVIGAAEAVVREVWPTVPLPFVAEQPPRPTETTPPKG